jgi:hypothetical protein
MRKLRRRLELIENRLPTVVEPEPSALERLIGLYDILIKLAKHSEKLGQPCPIPSAVLWIRRSQWKKGARTDLASAMPQAEKELETWRAKLEPMVKRFQKENR